MSLLLDALYKASKDKEKAGSLTLAPKEEPVAPPQELQLELPDPIIEKTLVSEPEPELATPVSNTVKLDDPFPSLELELEPRPFGIHQEVVADAPVELAQEVLIEPKVVVESVPQPIEQPVQKSTIEFEVVEQTTYQIKETLTQAPKDEPIMEPIKTADSISIAAPETETKTPVDVPQETSVVNEVKVNPVGAKAIKQPGKIAQILSRTKNKQTAIKSTTNKRIYVLGGIAAVLLLGLGAMFLVVGMESSGLTPMAKVQPVAPTEISTPPAVEEPVKEATAQDIKQVEKEVATNTSTLPTAKESQTNKAVNAETAQTLEKPPQVANEKVVAMAPKEGEVAFRPTASKAAVVTSSVKPNYLEIAYAALVDGRLEEASQSYARVLKSNPYERDALLGMAYIAHQRGQRDDALYLYQRVLRQDPTNTVAAAAVLALDTRLESSAATLKAKDLVDRQPDSVAALSTAANSMVRDGMFADAALLYMRAQRLEPENPLHVYNHAVALDRLGQLEQAIEQYKKVIKLAERQLPTSVRPFSMEAVRIRLNELQQSTATTSVNLP